MRISQILAFVAATTLANTVMSADQKPSTAKAGGDNQPAPMVLLVPIEISNPAMNSGCWAQFYDERNFKGDMMTIVGPMQIDSTDS